MRYRLLALDLDGTTLGPDLAISRRARRAFSALRRRGMAIAVATGRRPVMAERFAREMGANAPLVASDGAYVFRPGQTLAVRPIPAAVAAEIFTRARSHGLRVVLYTPVLDLTNQARDFGAYLSFAWRRGHLYKPRAFSNLVYDFTRPRQVILHSAEVESLTVPVLKIIPFGTKERLTDLREELTTIFSAEITFTAPGAETLEIVAHGVNKAVGLSEVADALGLTPEQVVAVGDSWNDEAMLRWAGLGVAMGNAPEALRRLADAVAPPVQADGLARFIEENLLAD